jgi:hypothetical protein
MWVTDIWMGKDKNALVFVAQGTKSAYVYRKVGATYSQAQVIPSPVGTYKYIIISDDEKYLVVTDSVTAGRV